MATRRGPGLVAACDDGDLLRFPLWPRQRQLLQAVEQGPRVHVWALGRRSGKTTMGALVALQDCLLRPELGAMVRPGERRYAVAVATNLRQARLFVRAALSIVERSPRLAGLVESVSDDEIAFITGTTLAAFPCTTRGVRGWPISTLLFDEAAHMLDTDGNQSAEPLWRALVPSTAQFGDLARIVVSSTPWGTEGLFADLYAQAASGELTAATAATATTAEMNPTIDPGFLAAEHDRDPDGFRGEYLAEFTGSGGAFLDPDRIAAAAGGRGELDPPDAAGWVCGLDPAFSSDPFGLCLVGRDLADPARLVLGLAREWKPTRATSFEERRLVEDELLAHIAALVKPYGPVVVTDQFCARAIVDRLRSEGLFVKVVPMTAATKTAAFGELRARLNLGTLDLYDERALLAQLRRLRTRYAAGSATVDNPRVKGSHGDLAQALAIAVAEHDRWGTRSGVHVQASSGGDSFGGGAFATERDPAGLGSIRDLLNPVTGAATF